MSDPTEGNEKLLKAIEALNTSMADLPGAVQKSVETGMTGVFQSLSQQQQQRQQNNDDDEPDPEPVSDDDLEKMDRRQLVGHISTVVTGEVQKLLKPLASKIDDTQTSAERDRITREVTAAREKHKDFDEFAGEIRESVKANPNLSIEDHYQLVKTKNPEKVEELRKKAEAAEKEKKEKEEAEKNPRKFGGMQPGSGGKSESSTRMTTKDAAEAAWEEAMADVSDQFIG